MNRKFTLSIIAILAVVLAIVFVILLRPTPETEADRITIGAILPLTGPLAYLGEEERNVLILLQEELQAEGKNVTFRMEDSGGLPHTGVSAYRRLELDGVQFFIVALNRIAESIQPIIREHEGIMIALSIDPGIARRDESTFRIYYGLEGQIPLWLSLLKDREAGRVAFLHAMDATVDHTLTMFRDSLAQAGIAYAGRETYEVTQTDVRQSVLRAIALGGDIIIAEDFGNHYPAILEEAERHNVRDRMIAGAAMLVLPPMDERLLEGVPFIGPGFVIDNTDAYAHFQERYRSRFGTAVSFDGIFAYIGGRLLADAISEVGLEANQVRSFLSDTTFQVFGESLRIDDTGTAHVRLGVGEYRNATIVPFTSPAIRE